MRKKIVAGNWKMNKSRDEACDFFNQIRQSALPDNVQLMVFPPFLYLTEAVDIVNKKVIIGAQNCHFETKGAFTGEISSSMIASVGANAVMVGHSERRQYFNETDAILAKKASAVVREGLTLIFCCGEMLHERENQQHFKVVEEQLKNGLFHLSSEQFTKVIIAYEPVWAIGTGKTASASDAQDMHCFIRSLLSQIHPSVAHQTSILYGGSCTPANAKELFKQPDIDGGLIGGASLNVSDFLAIANSF